MDTKTIERLKKLVKLANHNPNDNEANSAARVVCRLLEQHDFKLDPTWNDVKRSDTPFWRSTPPSPKPKEPEPPKTAPPPPPRYKSPFTWYGFDEHENLADILREYARTSGRRTGYSDHTTQNNAYVCRKCGATFVTQNYIHHPICPTCKNEEERYQASVRNEGTVQKCVKCGHEVKSNRKIYPFICRFCEEGKPRP